MSEPLTTVKKEVESLFESHIEEGTPDESPETHHMQLFSHISSLPLGSRKQLFMLLSCISNFHNLCINHFFSVFFLEKCVKYTVNK